MKKKLALKDLQVQSFVTDVELRDQQNVIGGAQTPLCNLTLPLNQCITNIQASQCPTCGIACTVNCA